MRNPNSRYNSRASTAGIVSTPIVPICFARSDCIAAVSCQHGQAVSLRVTYASISFAPLHMLRDALNRCGYSMTLIQGDSVPVRIFAIVVPCSSARSGTWPRRRSGWPGAPRATNVIICTGYKGSVAPWGGRTARCTSCSLTLRRVPSAPSSETHFLSTQEPMKA